MNDRVSEVIDALDTDAPASLIERTMPRDDPELGQGESTHCSEGDSHSLRWKPELTYDQRTGRNGLEFIERVYWRVQCERCEQCSLKDPVNRNIIQTMTVPYEELGEWQSVSMPFDHHTLR